MIIQIDDQYFNPLMITELVQDETNVKVYLNSSIRYYLVFMNWSVNDLAAEINRCIEEF